jgi:hypothetical protein
VTDKAKPPKAPPPAEAGGAALSSGGGPALSAAIAALLPPIAELAVARGLPFAAVEELFKAAFVEAARLAQPESAGGRIVSRVATATGLTRREVARLVDARDTAGGPPPVRPSPATQVFTRWRADPTLRDRRGRPKALPRQGPAPSFEALARSVTQDVHPRSLLDELCRLGLAEVVDDEVRLLRESVVAGRDSERAFAFLGSNVGDHLRAGVANVLADAPPHLEQAVFADELSAESIAAFREIAKAEWQALLAATVPKLQALIDADAKANRTRDQRVRIGLYTYHDAMGDPPATPRPADAATPSAAKRRRLARKDR